MADRGLVGAIARLRAAVRVIDALVVLGVTVVGDDAQIIAAAPERGRAIATIPAVRVHLAAGAQAHVVVREEAAFALADLR